MAREYQGIIQDWWEGGASGGLEEAERAQVSFPGAAKPLQLQVQPKPGQFMNPSRNLSPGRQQGELLELQPLLCPQPGTGGWHCHIPQVLQEQEVLPGDLSIPPRADHW